MFEPAKPARNLFSGRTAIWGILWLALTASMSFIGYSRMQDCRRFWESSVSENGQPAAFSYRYCEIWDRPEVEVWLPLASLISFAGFSYCAIHSLRNRKIVS